MITKELIEYLRSEQAKGTPVAAITQQLSTQGWTPADIQEALKTLAEKSETEPVKKGIIPSVFRTKGSSFGFFLLLILIGTFFGRIAPIFSILGGFLPLAPLALFTLIAILLKLFGYKKESENAVKAIGMLLLVIIVLAIIGFGICVLMLSNWH